MQEENIKIKARKLVKNYKSTLLHYYFSFNEHTESSLFLEHDLPTPTLIVYRNTGFSYIWAINGFFNTQKGREYLEDVKHKLTSLLDYFNISYRDACDVSPNLNDDIRLYEKIYELGEFTIDDYRIRSVQEQYREEVTQLFSRVDNVTGEDRLFEASRYRIYALKRENRLTYDNVFNILYSINLTLFHSKYTYADLRSKAKNMFHWTEEYYIGSGGDRRAYQREYMREYRKRKDPSTMTRNEAARKARNVRSEQVRVKIFSAVENLKSRGKLLKKDGKINASLLATTAGVDRRSVLKHIDLVLDE